jgi:hypothetical protein
MLMSIVMLLNYIYNYLIVINKIIITLYSVKIVRFAKVAAVTELKLQ